MKLKNFGLLGLTLFAVLFFFAVGVQAKTLILKFAHEAPEQHVGKGQTAIKFAEYVEKYSNGQIKVNVYPSAQLVPTKEEIRACARGQVDIIAPYTPYLATIEKDFQIFFMPMLFKNEKQAIENFKGPIGEKLLGSLDSHGLKGLSIWHDGPVNLFMQKDPANKLEDLKGKKIRTAPSKPTEAALRELGSIPVSLPGSEVFLALQQGVADGVVTTPTYALSSRWDEVLKGMTKVLFGWGGYTLCISNKTWDKMNNDQHEIIIKAANEATKWNEANSMKYVESSLKGLQDHGVKIISLESAEQERWSKLMENVYKNQSPSLRGLIEEIQGK